MFKYTLQTHSADADYELGAGTNPHNTIEEVLEDIERFVRYAMERGEIVSFSVYETAREAEFSRDTIHARFRVDEACEWRPCPDGEHTFAPDDEGDAENGPPLRVVFSCTKCGVRE